MAIRRNEWTSERLPISYETQGVTHQGHFQAEKGMIRVTYKGGEKVTQLGGSSNNPASLARIMLAEIVRETASE